MNKEQELLFQDAIKNYILNEKRDFYTNPNLSNNLVTPGLDALNKLDKEKLKKLIEVSNNFNKTENKVIKEKEIRTLLSASIYLDKFYEKVENLDSKELCVLSFYSSFSPVEEYEYSPVLFNKNILKEVVASNKGIIEEVSLLQILREKIASGVICSDEEAIDFIKNNSDLIYNEKEYGLEDIDKHITI